MICSAHPKRKFLRRKRHFGKQNGIQKLGLNDIPNLDRKIMNVKQHSEIETTNLFVEERWVL